MMTLRSLAFDKNENACHFMNYKDIQFKPLHNVLNNNFKKLLSEGIGAEKSQARAVTEAEEDILWEKGILGWQTPLALRNAVFYHCGLYFCLRGGAEHLDLKYSQFQVKYVQDPVDSTKTIRCVANIVLMICCIMELRLATTCLLDV